MIKGVIFDVDGTLTLSNSAHAHAWQEAFKEYGYETSYDELHRLIGMGGDKLISELYPDLSADKGTGKTIKDRRKEIFLTKYVDSLLPATGSRDLVLAVQKAGLATVVASSSEQEELSAILAAGQVEDLLTQTTTSDDAQNSKPDPDIVQVALKKLGLQPDEVIMLGDTPYDIQAASKAGTQCIAVRCGGWDDDELTGALAIFQDPADLLANYTDVPITISSTVDQA